MSSILDPKISSAYIGINIDADPLTIQEGEYTYCLNGSIIHTQGLNPFVGNNEGNVLSSAIPDGFMVIGSRRLDRNDSVLMLVNLIGESQIGIFVNGKYTTAVKDKRLGFTITSQITVRFKTNYKGERIIYWTDNNQPPLWMNLDKPNFIKTVGPDGCTLVDTDQLDLDYMKIFKDYVMPCIVVEEITEDGSLKSGGYFLTGQYADIAGNGLTATFPLIGDIPIYARGTSEAFDSIVGVPSGVVTSKAIKISISGADTSFTHINIIAIKVINGTIEAFIVGRITTTTTQFVYNGFGNSERPMLLDDVIRPAVKYNRAKALEVTNSQLILGNLWSERDFNFQPYFQKVEVQWQSFKAWSDDTVNSFKNPKFAAYMRCFRRDEVYALAGVLDFIDGTSSKAWHIPGRKLNKKANGNAFTQTVDQFGNAINPAQWDTAAIYSGDDVYDNVAERYKIYNTATIEGNASTGQDADLGEYGEMGFYESTDLYDCNKELYGDDAGKPIRFHLMPDSSIFHIHDGEDGARGLEERVKINYLGIRLPNMDDIIATMPPEIRAKIKGWRVVIGDRTYNKSVLASGIMLNALRQNWEIDSATGRIDDTRFYPNYPLNDLRPDPYISKAMGNNNKPINNPRNDLYNKDVFFFHSPDTHFKKQYISPGQLKINVELYGKTDSYYDYADPYPEFREKGDDNDKAALLGYSIGWYNNYTKVQQNNTRRKLNDAFYVPFNAKVSGGTTKRSIWNVFRESSVFLSTSKEVNNPTHQDTSRFIMSDRDAPEPAEAFNCSFGHKKRKTSVFYGTLKKQQPNQYGNINDIVYLETYQCRPSFIPQGVVFGGDTYIGKFSMKLQNIFYQNAKSYIGANNGIDGADFKPAETVANTTYYYRNLGAGGNPRTQSTMMCEDNTGHGLFGIFGDGDATALGYLALGLTGVPVFWAESDFNIDLRHPGDTSEQTFYPNLNSGIYKLKDWLSIRNIDSDNYFKYNEDFSFKNGIKLNEAPSPFYDPLSKVDTHYATRVIYTLKSQPEDIQDNWLKFQPLDYYDLAKNKGELIDIRYLGNYRTLFRMVDTVYMDVLYGQMESTLGKINLGSGKLFEREPEEILSTDNSYGGTISQYAFNNTEYGPMFVSNNSRTCFTIDGSLKDIATGASSWLYENLPFKLAQQIKVLSTDNACNPEGIGMLSEWDRTTKTWYLTKKDYEVIDPANIPLLHYKDNKRLYLRDKEVSLQDETLFANKSWTFAYSPARQHWISWHSFMPNFYFINAGELYTGLNKEVNGIWQHNVEGIYTTYYGKQYPWIIEGVDKADGVNTVVNPSLSFITQAILNKKNEIVTFNKAMLYNMFMHSGMLNLIIQDELDLSTLFSQFNRYVDSRDIALRPREGHFNFSDFYDIYNHGAQDFFTDNWSSADFRKTYPIDKVINTPVMNYDTQENDYSLLREKWVKYRFILDNRFDVKLLLQVTSIAMRKSIS